MILERKSHNIPLVVLPFASIKNEFTYVIITTMDIIQHLIKEAHNLATVPETSALIVPKMDWQSTQMAKDLERTRKRKFKIVSREEVYKQPWDKLSPEQQLNRVILFAQDYSENGQVIIQKFKNSGGGNVVVITYDQKNGRISNINVGY